MSDPLPTDYAAGALGRDLTCGHCRHVHRWLACECGCPAHPIDDDVEP